MVPERSDIPGTDQMISSSAQAGKFVISLCTVAVPIAIPQPRSPELSRYQFFLHTSWEEGRRSHRLYMGYFVTREEADKWLGTLRRIYPSAFVGAAPEAEMLTNSQIVSLLDQPVSISIPARGAPIGGPAQPARAPELRPQRQEPRRSGPTLQDTIEALKVSTLDVDTEEDPLNTTGVRHLRIEIQKEGPRVRGVKRSGSRK